MNKISVFVALACLLAVSAASDRLVVSTRTATPPGWKLMGPAHPDQKIKVTFALVQNNLEQLEALFWSKTDPASKDYANWMSIEEVMEVVAPTKEEHDNVFNFLLKNGVSKNEIISLRDSIVTRMTVALAAKLFNTKFFNFVNKNGVTISRQMGAYSIPKDIAKTVEMVTGVSDFPMDRPNPSKAKNLKNANDAFVIPQTLYKLYNIPAGTRIKNPKSSQGVVEFQNDNSFLFSDLATFYTDTAVTTTNVTKIVGPLSSFADGEATLDIQYITAVGLGATNWYWTESNWMYDFANHFFNSQEVPLVVSMSWGWSEVAQCSLDNDCSTLGIDAQTYVNRVNTEFQKIGLRGVSLLASSGDSGANGRTDGTCTDSKLHPNFPASSPYVTAVGATQLKNPQTSLSNPPPVCAFKSPCASGGEEVAVSYDVASFTSGGGFSEYLAQPAYQKDAVAKFLNSSTKLPPSSYFNARGRGYPDVAAEGHNFVININGALDVTGGTSASSPTFAGVIALLNDYQITKTGKSLGPLNPLLYKIAAERPSAFNDILSGDNICTENGCSATCKGFTAQAGWDPVTGLGSPNYLELLAYLKSL